MSDLKKYEGREVVGTAIKVTKAGDGLSAALEIEPVELHHDDVVYLVLKTKVAQVVHKASRKGSKSLIRSHVLETEAATIVDGQEVAALLEAQALKIEEAQGIQRLKLEAEANEALEQGR